MGTESELDTLRARCAQLEDALEDCRRKQQAELGELDEQLRAGEFWRLTIESMSDTVFVTDERGAFRYVCPNVSVIFGHDAEAVRAMGHVDALLGEGFFDFERVRREGELRNLEVAVRDAAGRPHALLVTVKQASLPGGAALIVCRDVTERRRAEEALARKEEELRRSQRMEALGRLASGIAHDFNNVLTVVDSTGELMQRQPWAGAASEDIQLIRDAARRGADIVAQLLAFARRGPGNPVAFDVRRALEGVDAMLARVVGPEVVREVSTAPDAWRIRIDPGAFEQLVLNLAFNARDAMPEGGTLRIEARNLALDATAAAPLGLEAGDYVELSFADTGVGMDDTTRERAFEPFYTTKDPDEGTGLGLSTCYGIVKQAGGTIAIDSEPGRGTRVRCYLPRFTAP